AGSQGLDSGMGDEQHEKNERDFRWILQVSSALSMGTLTAFLISLRSVSPHLELELSILTWVGFFIAAAVSWIFWRIVLDRPERSDREGGGAAALRARRWKFVGISAALVLAMLWGFRYELRDVSPEKRSEVLEGVVLAFALLAGLGCIF